MFPDIWNDDAFGLVALTTLINEVDHVPGRAGALAFAGVGEGITTDNIGIEMVPETLSLIPTTPRSAPSPQEVQNKGNIRKLGIPQIKLEDRIGADQLFGVRRYGTTDQLQTAQFVLGRQLDKMAKRHDLTLENLRLGAIRGRVLDADGSELVNLYQFFGVPVPPAFDFSDVITGPATTDAINTIRTRCHAVVRYMKRNLKAPWPTSAYVHAFCGDNFFDAIVEGTREVYDGYAAAERRLGDNYAFGMYEFGGIIWENYQGTDDNSTVAVASNTARFFPVGVPGLFEEYYAPGDFLDEVGVGAVGLPRYARIAPDPMFNRYVMIHTQQNPLPICTRPRVLVEGTFQAPVPPTEAETETAT